MLRATAQRLHTWRKHSAGYLPGGLAAPMRGQSVVTCGSTSRLHLPSLDGARGLAILMVMCDHMSSAKIIPFPSCRGIGHIGVYMFFALSAFLLTAPLSRKQPQTLTAWETWRVYFWRRFMRIYPLYIMVLLTDHFTGMDMSWRAIGEHLLLRRGQSIFWTMEIEVKYYLILPLLVLTFFVAWRRSRKTGALCTLGTIAVLYGLHKLEEGVWTLDGHGMREYILIFLFGSIAGWLYASVISHPPRSRTTRWLCEGLAVVGIAGAVINLPAISRHLPAVLPSGSRWGASVVGLCWTVFLLGHLYGTGSIKRLLEWKPLRYIGIISYSLYIWHEPVMRWLWFYERAGHSLDRWYWPVHTAIELAAIFLVSSVSYLLVERPLSRINARFAHSLVTASPPPARERAAPKPVLPGAISAASTASGR